MLALVLCAYVAPTAAATGGQWLMFQGDSQHSGLASQSGPDVGTINWSYNQGQVLRFSEPVVGQNGDIYIGNNAEGASLEAFAPDGSLLWSTPMASGRGMTPAAAGPDGRIYVTSLSAGFYAVNPDGTIAWSQIGNYGTPPTVGPDGTIYVGGPGSTGNDSLYAYNPDGTLRWVYHRGVCCTNDAPSISPDASQIYATWDDGEVLAFNAEGAIQWGHRTSGVPYGGEWSGTATVGADGTVYVPSCTQRAGGITALSQSGSLQWQSLNSICVIQAIATGPDGTLYFGGSDRSTGQGAMYAVNPDGTIKWHDPNQFPIDSYNTPAIGSDGTIYAMDATTPSRLTAFLPNGQIEWMTHISGDVGAPAIGQSGDLYIAGGDTLYDFQGVQGSPAPQVTGVSPTQGGTNGGDQISITGNGFAQGATVWFGQRPATNATWNSPTSITATTPSQNVGTVDVQVEDPTGQTSLPTVADRYTYNLSVSVTGVSPNQGPTVGGAQVSISGSGFVQGDTVQFGSQQATKVTVNSGGSITATTPAEAAGTVDITVTSAIGTSATSPADHYTYLNPPAIQPTVLEGNPGTSNQEFEITFSYDGTDPVNATINWGAPGLGQTVLPGPLGTILPDGNHQYLISASPPTPGYTQGTWPVIVTVSPSSGGSGQSNQVIAEIWPQNANPLIPDKKISPHDFYQIGMLTFQTPSGIHGCSAGVVSSINKSLILTAGHCVYGNWFGTIANPQFFSNFQFAPGHWSGDCVGFQVSDRQHPSPGSSCAGSKGQNNPLGVWTAQNFTVDSHWLANPTSNNHSHDYAFLLLSQSPLGATQPQTVQAATQGGIPLDFAPKACQLGTGPGTSTSCSPVDPTVQAYGYAGLDVTTTKSPCGSQLAKCVQATCSNQTPLSSFSGAVGPITLNPPMWSTSTCNYGEALSKNFPGGPQGVSGGPWVMDRTKDNPAVFQGLISENTVYCPNAGLFGGCPTAYSQDTFIGPSLGQDFMQLYLQFAH